MASCYNELGDLYLDNLNKHSLKRNLVHGFNNPDPITGIVSLQNSYNSPRILQMTVRLTW